MLLRSLFILHLFFSVPAFAFPIKYSVSPDNSEPLLTETIQSARSSIQMNVYLITSFRLHNMILEKMRNGVTVEMLVEGEPYGKKIYPPEKKILDELAAAMDSVGNKKNRLLLMTSQKGKNRRRFNFNHAKYVIVDGSKIYVSSENFVNSGSMSRPGKKGNRGWQVMAEDPALASRLGTIFSQDSAEKNVDIVPYDPSLVEVVNSSPPPKGGDNTRTLPSFPVGNGNGSRGNFCTSPSALNCLLPFIRGAQKSLDLQQLSFPIFWSSPKAKGRVSPLVEEILQSASRGVQVRLLVNRSKDSRAPAEPSPEGMHLPMLLDWFGGNPPPAFSSDETVSYLEEAAKARNLPLKVAVANIQELQLYALHNKGMIADGQRVLVGSINGTENSVMYNRELALELESTDAAKFFGSVFELDWSKSRR